MQKIVDSIRQLGGDVLAISFAPAAFLSNFEKKQGLSFPIYSDAPRAAYNAFQLDRAKWSDFLRPLVIGKYLAHMSRGWMPGKPLQNDDLLQLGGDFIVLPDGSVPYSYRSVDPTDRPSNAALIKEFQKLQQSASTS